MSDIFDIFARVGNLLDDLEALAIGRTLTCQTCGRTLPAGGGNYFSVGWPKCCGHTMRDAR